MSAAQIYCVLTCRFGNSMLSLCATKDMTANQWYNLCKYKDMLCDDMEMGASQDIACLALGCSASLSEKSTDCRLERGPLEEFQTAKSWDWRTCASKGNSRT